MKDKKQLIRFGTSHDRRVAADSTLPIALPAAAHEIETNVDAPSSPSRPSMAPATRVLIERFGPLGVYADWLPLPSDATLPACSARHEQILVRMAHPDVLAPGFSEQLADALETAGSSHAMVAYLLPIIRSAAKRGPNP